MVEIEIHEWDYSLKELFAIESMVKELYHLYEYTIDNFKISNESVIFWDDRYIVEIYKVDYMYLKIKENKKDGEWMAEECSGNKYIYTCNSALSDKGKMYHDRVLNLIDKVWDHIIDKYIELAN